MIISGGVNIYPAEIEGELLTTRRSATPRCSASPTTTGASRSRPSSSRATGVEAGPELEAGAHRLLQDRIAKYKIPKSIDFVAELPRDPNGKLYKRKLRDPYWEGRARAI